MRENHLKNEKSPYLLQHARNPVDWYPWGEAAFEKAAREDRPVFLSIGYSTCHWCHVMERESFEDDAVAALLNTHFLPIKVDREERPDIDAVYMSVCQALTGSGGWPLTLLLTPDKTPFYAGTYLPPRGRFGAVGLIELLERSALLWREERGRLLETGEQIAAFVSSGGQAPARVPEQALLDEGFAQLLGMFDQENGGFGGAPKFPVPHNILFLLHRASGDKTALFLAETTLVQLARGGICDQIGGGFSRYSTDARWLAPHFEKMLYDNALLAYTYLEGHRITGRAYFRTVADRTLDYLCRELAGPEGEFFCGQDADSDGVEGKYYLLTPDEVVGSLGEADARQLCDWFDITPEGNFEGKSIPNLLSNPGFERPDPRLAPLCSTLREFRRTRVPLHLDDKALTSWNAMAIAAFAKAYRITGEPARLDAAQRCLRFVHTRLKTPNGRLLVRWCDGEAAHPGMLDDYAYILWALLELYAADFDPAHLDEAEEIAGWLETLFGDGETGGYFLYASDAERLISRPKELYDGAVPSGNSTAALALLLLAALTGDARWQSAADRQLAFLAGNIAGAPAHHTFALLAIARRLAPAGTLVCATADAAPDCLRGLAEAHGLLVLLKTPANTVALDRVSPLAALYPLPEDGTVFYHCRGGACQNPVHSLEELALLLDAEAR